MRAIIQLDPSADGRGTPSEFKTLINHRMVCDLNDAGGEAQNEARIKIYGLPLNVINQLTVVGCLQNQIRSKNRITVFAGDTPDAMTMVYSGTIFEAYGDFNSAPDVALEITAHASMEAAMTIAKATSLKDVAKVEFVMKQLANSIGYELQNDGVTETVTGYFYGAVKSQIDQCAREAGIEYSFDTTKKLLKIRPMFGSFDKGSPPVVVSPSTGMVGYPTASSAGLIVKTLFNPKIKLGHQIEIKGSQVTAANGVWTVNQVSHELESNVQNGRWFTNICVWANGQGSANG
jgi:hypothetical protein